MFILVCYAMRVQSLINNIFNIFNFVGFFFQFKNKMQMAEKKLKIINSVCVCVCVSIYISLNSSLWFFGIHLCFQQRPSCHTSDLTLSRTLIIQEYLPKIGLRPRSYLLPNKIIPDTPISLAEFSGSAQWITMYLLLFGTAVKKKWYSQRKYR